MTWFKLDDSFHAHPKVVAAGNEAIGLYVRCGTYAAEHLTDGFICEDIAVLYGARDTGRCRNPRTGKPETLAETLVRTKLWRRARAGWRMPDYLDYNPAKTTVERTRKTNAERQRRWQEAQRNAVINTVTNNAPARPVLSRGSGVTDPERPRPPSARAQSISNQKTPPSDAARHPSARTPAEATQAAGLEPRQRPARGDTVARLAAQARAALTQDTP